MFQNVKLCYNIFTFCYIMFMVMLVYVMLCFLMLDCINLQSFTLFLIFFFSETVDISVS